MGCGASSHVSPELEAHTATWTVLSVRIRWSGWDGRSPDMQLTITDDRGTILLTLHGGVPSNFAGFSTSRLATFSPYHADSRIVESGTAKKTRHTVWFIADGSSNELYNRKQGRWTRVSSGQAEADALPAALRVREEGSLIQVFTEDARAPADDEDYSRMVIQQPDDSTALAQREASALDKLIATVAKRGTRPRQDDGKADYSGDMEYSLKVKPALLASTDASARKLLLAICTDPFWTRGSGCVGYSPAYGGGGAM